MEFDLQVLLMLLGQKDYEIALLNKELADKTQELKHVKGSDEPKLQEVARKN